MGVSEKFTGNEPLGAQFPGSALSPGHERDDGSPVAFSEQSNVSWSRQ